MKYQDALDIINKAKGYMVTFDIKENSVLRGDNFPDKRAGEPLIPTEEEAWELAAKFANATGPEIVNIYVIDGNFSPVSGYKHKRLKSTY